MITPRTNAAVKRTQEKIGSFSILYRLGSDASYDSLLYDQRVNCDVTYVKNKSQNRRQILVIKFDRNKH